MSPETWMPATPPEWIALVISYLLGAVPFGWVIGRLRGVDIRKSGSRNIGATNAGRVLGRPFAVLAFAGDFGKGWLPVVWLAPTFAAGAEGEPALRMLCGLAAVGGHVWPVYLGFRGGKAVATTCGAVIGLDPLVFLLGGLLWIAVAAVSRFVGLASIAMALSFPLLAIWRADARESSGREVVWGTFVLALVIVMRHRANIARMRAGTEPRIGRSRG